MSDQVQPPQYVAITKDVQLELLNFLAKDPTAALYGKVAGAMTLNVIETDAPTPAATEMAPTPQV